MALDSNPHDFYSLRVPRQPTGKTYDSLGSLSLTGDLAADAAAIVGGIDNQLRKDPLLSDYTNVPGPRPSPEGPSFIPPTDPETPPPPNGDTD